MKSTTCHIHNDGIPSNCSEVEGQLTCASWTTFSRHCLAHARQLWARNCVAFYKVLMTITHGTGIMFRCPLSTILIELSFMITLNCFWHSAVKEN